MLFIPSLVAIVTINRGAMYKNINQIHKAINIYFKYYIQTETDKNN